MSEDRQVGLTAIIGGGPAGLQLAYFLQRSGVPYLLLEQADGVGAFFRHYPRHRQLLSINKVNVRHDSRDFRMRHDWNSLLQDEEGPGFAGFSKAYFPPADAIIAYLDDFARRHALAVRLNSLVASVARSADRTGFLIRLADGELVPARRVVAATGLARPHIPDIEGIELAEGYETMSVRPADFEGQRVLIIGKGNSALETANALLATAERIHLISPHPIRFAWDTHFAGHVRSANNMFFDSYLLKSMNGVIDAKLDWIRRQPGGALAARFASIHGRGESETLDYDRVLRCTGFRFDDSIFAEDCRPALACDGRLPDVTGAWESRNVPGLYFAGALMHALDYKRSQSSFIHGFRYNVRSLAALLAADDGTALRHRTAPADPGALAHAILEHLEVTDSLWQQVGFLCDVIVRPTPGCDGVAWYRDLNLRFIEEGGLERLGHDDAYAVMLAYGPRTGTAFEHPHLYPPSPDPLVFGDQSTEIHPVVRRYRGAQLVWEFHLRSDFLSQWNNPQRHAELRDFLERDLARAAPAGVQRQPANAAA